MKMSNKFVQEFGGKEDLFTNTIYKRTKGVSTGSTDNQNCKSCIDCMYCRNCDFCKNCINCDNCSFCENCVNCKNKTHEKNLIL